VRRQRVRGTRHDRAARDRRRVRHELARRARRRRPPPQRLHARGPRTSRCADGRPITGPHRCPARERARPRRCAPAARRRRRRPVRAAHDGRVRARIGARSRAVVRALVVERVRSAGVPVRRRRPEAARAPTGAQHGVQEPGARLRPGGTARTTRCDRGRRARAARRDQLLARDTRDRDRASHRANRAGATWRAARSTRARLHAR
jgi:hypothetical protein